MKLIKITAIITITAVLFLAAGCGGPKNPPFTLSVSTNYNGQPFVLGSPNTDPQGYRLKFDSFKFYLSHITLVKNDNSETEIKSVALINLANPNSLYFTTGNASGDFKAIKFNVGVDSVMNLTDPYGVPTDSPLYGSNDMYWTWLKYIFISAVGEADSTTSGPASYNMGLVYHLGGNAYYRQVVLNKSFSLCCDKPYSLALNLDVKKLFYGTTQTIDIVTERATNGDHPPLDVKIADNFAGAFTVN